MGLSRMLMCHRSDSDGSEPLPGAMPRLGRMPTDFGASYPSASEIWRSRPSMCDAAMRVGTAWFNDASRGGLGNYRRRFARH